jgi:hypothetical protein
MVRRRAAARRNHGIEQDRLQQLAVRFLGVLRQQFVDALLQMDHAAMASGRLIGRGTRGPLAARAIEPTEQS